MTRALVLAAAGLTGLLALQSAAVAQGADTSCAAYLKADAEATAGLSEADKAMLAASPEAAAIDAKLKGYCKAHPTASLTEAATKSAQ